MNKQSEQKSFSGDISAGKQIKGYQLRRKSLSANLSPISRKTGDNLYEKCKSVSTVTVQSVCPLVEKSSA